MVASTLDRVGLVALTSNPNKKRQKEVSVKTILLCFIVPELGTQRNNTGALKKVSDDF